MSPVQEVPLPIRADEKPSWKLQVWATVISDLAPMCAGMALGFTGICFPHLREDSIIQLTEKDELWMASLYGAGGVVGAVLMSPVADVLGRRKSLLVSSVLFLLGWVTATAALNLASLQTSRFLLGMGAGCQAGTQLAYASEVSETRLRAVLTCSSLVGQYVGVSLVFLLGLLVSWRLVAGLSAVVPLALMALVMVVPDSPASLLSRGLTKQAEVAFRRFRGKFYDQRAMEEEVRALERSQRRFPGPHTIHWRSQQHLAHLRSKPVLKSFLLLGTFSLICEFAGAAVIVSYAVDVFESFGEAVDKYTASLVGAVVQLALSSLGLVLVHFLSRRFLAVTSGAGMALILGAMSLYLYLHGSPESWVFVVGLWLYLLFFTPGLLMLHLLLRAELFPLRIRATGATVVAAMDFLFIFASLMLFPSMKTTLTTAGIFCVFAIVSLLGAIFCFFMVPETMGKSLSQIEEELLVKDHGAATAEEAPESPLPPVLPLQQHFQDSPSLSSSSPDISIPPSSPPPVPHRPPPRPPPRMVRNISDSSSLPEEEEEEDHGVRREGPVPTKEEEEEDHGVRRGGPVPKLLLSGRPSSTTEV